ncbi:hypothetical protein niasHT_034893 [Heterodera trifolii]|uniref:RING-type domain-containing protein n=1 Tax=Heterodera trifolii TaxID=157864 RepID=A0ABD2I5L1_9BILA
MYTAVDNLNIAANIKNEPDKKNKRNRRKKRFVDLASIGFIAFFIVLTIIIWYISAKIGIWLSNQRIVANIVHFPISLARNALTNFQQKRVSNAVSGIINQIPEHIVENGCSNDDDDNCAICLGTHETGDKVRTLLCTHQFHSVCVDEWIKKHNNCPSCRAEVFNIDSHGKAKLNKIEHLNQMPTATENEQQNPDNSITENV